MKDAICWRPTKLEASFQVTLSRALVEETPKGWVWSVYRGTSLVDSGGYFQRLTKDEAIAEAAKVLRGGQR